MRPFVILAALLSLATPVLAGDAGTIAAALPDEASECRYLLQLDRDFDAAMAEHAVDRYERLGRDRADAARVIRAKHPTMPACFRELHMKTDWLE